MKRQENRDGPNRTAKRAHESIHHRFERSADTALHHDNGSQNRRVGLRETEQWAKHVSQKAGCGDTQAQQVLRTMTAKPGHSPIKHIRVAIPNGIQMSKLGRDSGPVLLPQGEGAAKRRMRESGLELFRKLIPSPAAHLAMGGTLSLRERDSPLVP